MLDLLGYFEDTKMSDHRMGLVAVSTKILSKPKCISFYLLFFKPNNKYLDSDVFVGD